jgi:hypothetical protein
MDFSLRHMSMVHRNGEIDRIVAVGRDKELAVDLLSCQNSSELRLSKRDAWRNLDSIRSRTTSR